MTCSFDNSFKELVSRNRAIIMGVAMILVVLYHQNFENEGLLWDFFHRYGYWGADLFLFISGMGIANSLEKNTTRKYYINRCWRLLPACLITGIISLAFIRLRGSMDTLQFPIWFYLTSMTNWYITAIIVYYVVAPFLFALTKKSGYLFLVLTIILTLLYLYKVYQFLIPYYYTYRWYVEATVSHLPVFVFGMYIGIKDVKSIFIFSFVSAMALFAAVIVTVFVDEINGFIGVGYKYLLVMGAMPFLILLINWGRRFCPDRIIKGIEWIGGLTLEIYLLHGFAFEMANNCGVYLYNFLKLFIAFVLALIIAFCLQKITQYLRIFFVKIVD